MNIYAEGASLKTRISELELKSIRYRRAILTSIAQAGAGHTGGSLSCIDILNVLYNAVLRINPANPLWPDRDRYIHSKGHAVEALYVVLADKGYFPARQLATIGHPGSHWVGHPTRKVPGIEHNTGALGHGLSVAVGMALAAKMDRRPYRVFVLLGDGELTEGSVWEASMSASFYKLDNLVAIVDRNMLQITGRTEEVMALEPVVDRFASFGYAVRVVDGHDVAALEDTLSRLPFEPGKPSFIIARTVKGKGVSFMEGAIEWHHRVPSAQELADALIELDQAERRWQETHGTDGNR